ncbi:hypothetical protein BDP27DRAFT_1416247 [Rhodocollybia butyracea]|uniref:Uncharacterized protein n=1 Tax=Rhodocollybia butyracea TaxID=206335 RepID=A0A9P5Q3Z5_9AGAR|nr:hypothetical protein BDP27DRAFT_1416247 [Rhodocollybia butyracea]
MLSSFSSLLPSALQHINSGSGHTSSHTSHGFGHSNPGPPPVVDDEDTDEEGDIRKLDPSTTKKKGKKEKGVNETFIFVRPPPAKSNHPLNLQVQLVPPNSRAPGVTGSSTTPRQSLDGAESDTSGAPLARTSSSQSNRSDVSSYSSSGYASTASFSSVGSTASGTGRRMIIPLYNLQAHNVMTNTIVDAGTDAKIAKFTKKGLEMIDLAMLEVVEVWPAPANVNAGSARGSLDEGGGRARKRLSLVGNPHLRPSASRPTTPDPERFTPGSSVVSVSSAGLSVADDNHNHYESSPAPPTVQKKNIFGKLFKRKDVDLTPTPPYIIPPSPTKTPTQAPHSHSLLVPSSPTSNVSRHGRNLSASMANFNRRGGSASPSRPGSSSGTSEGLGIRGFMSKHVRPSNMHGDDVHTRDYAYEPEFGGVHPDSNVLSTTSSRISTASRTSNHSNSHEPPPMSSTNSSSVPSSTASTATIILPATLGIQPTLSAPGGPSTLGLFVNFTSGGYPPPKSLGFGRGPRLYVWVIRKWIKGPERAHPLENGTLFGGKKSPRGMGGMLSPTPHGVDGAGANLSEIEVRVEWKRGKKSKSKKSKKVGAEDGEGRDISRNVSRSGSQRRASRTRTGVRGVAAEQSPSGSMSSLPSETSYAREALSDSVRERDRKTRNRQSTTSASRTSMERSDDDEETGKGEGNDSDPEDSETPWTFAGIKLPLKLKIATLSPTPHHPKVVALLKVPYPLPDLEVQKMELRKRPGLMGGVAPAPPTPGLLSASTSTSATSTTPTPTPTGSAFPSTPKASEGAVPLSPPMQGLVLKAEEIKDVVCSTGLWVVVREGFGGVGKVSRKGDGWRIRA